MIASIERTSDNPTNARKKLYTKKFEENKFGCKPLK
jgi:hypothetical protein